MKAAVFTVSTRAYKEKEESRAGAAVKRVLEQVGFEVKGGGLPEDRDVVATVMKRLSDSGAVQLIITTGASGFLKKDCAPDALADIADRLLPGIPEAIRAYSIRYTKKVVLDRSAAGIRGKTLLLNLPEGAKAAKDGLEYVLQEVIQVAETINV